MPMSRYQIRSEYSLSDPELYRSADKDDPEALLEGVAMAGLVGVLRQLGDLAEFAAEIFHDLHEEVMVTAARGHDLMTRVQDLEAEIPSIERAFLFQTDHSRFFYNPGVDWHPSFSENKNHVTYGDMPRFVMNSYEDCRGPPRLFLLDKYDIGGAGACLKRYTDPGFFRLETSRSSIDGLSNSKTRKAKKRGPHLNNNDAAVALMRSNPKLHQLFLEEPTVKSVNKPARVKLKRRLNGFPFDTKSGKSYMEKLFATPTEHEMQHGVSRTSSSWLPTNVHSESDPDIHEVRSVSPVRKSIQRIKSRPRPDEPGTLQSELTYVRNDVPSDKIRPEHVDETSETDIHVDGERKQESSVAREKDDHPAIPSATGLEGEIDFETRGQNGWMSSFLERQISVGNHEKFYSRPSDSHASTSSDMYEEGSNATKNSSSVSPFMKRTSARTSFTERKDVFSLEMIDKGCSADGVHDNYLNSVALNENAHNAELLNSVTLSTDPSYSSPRFDSEEVSSEAHSKEYPTNEIASVLQYNEKESAFMLGSPSFKNRSSDMQLQVNSHILNESNSVNSTSASMVSEYNSVSSNSHSLHEDNYDQKVVKPMESSSFLSNNCAVVLHQDTGYDMKSTQSVVCTGERQENLSDSEGVNAVSASQEFFPCIVEASIRKDTIESCSTHSEIESNSSHDKRIDSEILAPVVNETLPYIAYDGQETHAVTGDNFLESTSFSGSEKSRSNGETDVNSTNDFVDVGRQRSSFSNSVGDAIVGNRGYPGFEMNEVSSPADMEISSYSTRENVILPAEKPVSVFADSGRGILADDFGHPEMDHVKNAPEILSSSCGDHDDMNFSEMERKNTVATKDINEFFCSNTSFRNVGSVEFPTILDSNLAPLVENSSDHVYAIATSSMQIQQRYFLDKNQDSFLHSGQQNEIYYGNPLCDHDTAIQERKRPPLDFSRTTQCPTSLLDNLENLVNDVPQFPKEASNFTSPFHDEDQIAINETPPMPPLPPFKWRMGKLPHFPVGSSEIANDDRPLPSEISKPFSSGDARFMEEEIGCSSPYAHDGSPKDRLPVLQSSLIHTTFHHPPEMERKEQQQISYTVEVVDQNKFLPPEISIPDTSRAASKEESINQSSSISKSTSKGNSKEQQNSSEVVRDAVNHDQLVLAEVSMQAASSDSTASIEKISSSASHPVPDTNFKEGSAEISMQVASRHATVSIERISTSADNPVSDTDFKEVSASDATDSVEKISSSADHPVPDTKFKEGGAEGSSSLEADLSKDNTSAAHSDARHVIELVNSTEAQFISGTKSREEKTDQSSSAMEADLIHTHPQPEIESRKLPSAGSDEITREEGVANEIRKGKLPRPHNPLIDAVSALDRSKLRKVVTNERSQAPKVNERNSLLEQIRTKSFNLKPATGFRPRVEAPRTNLRVAAILEKANAIRQALTGSDEDDDENWSDS